jgi:hypothetical protein
MDVLRYLTKLPGFRFAWRKMPLGSVHTRTSYDIWNKPPYAFGVYSAAALAKKLGIKAISVVEFGVAGGDGLVILEEYSRLIGSSFDLHISVYGFDSGAGMPKPSDYRDLPYVWDEGYYAANPADVRKRLKDARLIVGNVETTLDDFLRSGIPPVGFISFDLDYYSSTMQAFKVFDGNESTRLPRVFCYFDDIIWPERACFNEFTGECGALNQFNSENDKRKIAKWLHLSWTRPFAAAWNDEMYVFHDFCHKDYNANVSPPEGE